MRSAVTNRSTGVVVDRVRAELAARAVAAGRSTRQLLREHGRALLAVAVASAIGQISVLLQSPLYQRWPDSAQYLADAGAILTHFQFVDALRTPGYPAFLAASFALTGGVHLTAVVIAQTVLVLVTTAEVYVLAYLVWKRRALAATIAAVLGINPLIANYERAILSETLAYWSMVTLFLIYVRLVRAPRLRTYGWFAVILVVAILVRPQFIYLPIALAIPLVLQWHQHGHLRARGTTLAVSLTLVYVIVVGYVGANGAVTGYAGLSDISNLNLFGKVLEYRMEYLPDAGTDPRFAQFHSDVIGYLQHTSHTSVVSQVWDFVAKNPQYDAHYWAIYGTYSERLIEHHPLMYLELSAHEVISVATAPPLVFAVMPYMPPWVVALIVLGTTIWAAYWLIPALLIRATARFWLVGTAESVVELGLLLAVVCNIVLCAFTDFTEFGRLRMPLDWAMIALAIVGCEQAVSVASRHLAAWRGHDATHVVTRPAE